MSNEKPITIAEAVTQAVAQLDGPISRKELVARVLVIRPSQARKPAASINNHLRWQARGRTLVYLDRQTIVPLRIAMRGVRFRIPLSRKEIKRRFLFIDPGFRYFLRREIAYDQVRLLDEAGRSLPARVVTLKQKRQTSLGSYEYEIHAFDLGDWFRAHRIRHDDSILVTIEDWEKGSFRLEHEPAKQRREQEIEQKNQELAGHFFDLLESARYESVYAHIAVPTAYARLSDPQGYPGDHWAMVIKQDARMKWDGSDIRYSESFTPLEQLSMGLRGEEAKPPREVFSPDQARQVYRFKAALKYRKGLWRRIEIRGDQTLANFDFILRGAFQHDHSDHMAGFWKRVQRGSGKRYREIDLGNVNPLGEGSGADRRIAGLGLAPGDTLKYVYDFGDWIEHLITLEEIVEPEEETEYPRVVGQNRPRHRYCEECKAEGRKTVATWICVECSEQEQRNVLLCEDCLMANHEGHYADELLY